MKVKSGKLKNLISLLFFLVVVGIFVHTYTEEKMLFDRVKKDKIEMKKMEENESVVIPNDLLDSFYTENNINLSKILKADDDDMKQKLVELLNRFPYEKRPEEYKGDERRAMESLFEDTLILGDSQVAHIKYSGALDKKYLAFMPGLTLLEQLDKIDSFLDEHKDVKNVVLWNGFNIFGFKDVNEFLDAYQKVYDKVYNYYDGNINIYVCSLLPARDDALFNDLTSDAKHNMYKGPEYDHALREYFGDKYLNLHFLVRNEFYTTDGVHFGPYFNYVLAPYLAYYIHLSHSNPNVYVSISEDAWKVATGSIIKIGNFYDKKRNELVEAPLRFKVVENDGRNIICVSYDILDNVPYAKEEKCDYDDSYLRKYLTEYFYKSCFTDIERSIMRPVYKRDYISAMGIDEYRRFINEGFNFATDNSRFSHDKVDKINNAYIELTGNIWLRDSFYIAYNFTNEYKVLHLSTPFNQLPYGVRPIIKLDIDEYLKYASENHNEIVEKEEYENFYLSYFEDKNFGKDALQKVKTNQKTVFLTFDDGPSELTDQILDLLDEYNVKATFFICDYGYSDKERIKRMIASGHTIGLHCFSHYYEELYTSVEDYLANIEKLKKKVKEDFGIEPKLIRFPGGSANEKSFEYSKGIMTKLVRIMHEKGYEFYDWNITSGDANPALETSELVNNVIKGLNPFRENVVLCHDSKEHGYTVAALPEILKYLISEGYVIDKINSNTLPIHKYVVN